MRRRLLLPLRDLAVWAIVLGLLAAAIAGTDAYRHWIDR